MPTTRIKICGITRAEDARSAVECGVDAIGLVFYPPSPRAVTAEQAAEIVRELPPFVSVVSLFVDEPWDVVQRTLSVVPVDVIQFHGDEDGDYCSSFARPYVKAVRMKAGTDLAAVASEHPATRALLLDSWQDGVPGGTGQTFDWQQARQAVGRPLVLAGGLNADNVADGMATVAPAAVDVSGGVESSPGIKDADKIRQFVMAVRAADRRNHGE